MIWIIFGIAVFFHNGAIIHRGPFFSRARDNRDPKAFNLDVCASGDGSAVSGLPALCPLLSALPHAGPGEVALRGGLHWT